MPNRITHCPFFNALRFFLLAHRIGVVCLLHLDSSRARLWRMDLNPQHLLVLHWRLHPNRCLRSRPHNKFPRLLLCPHGTWLGSDPRESPTPKRKNTQSWKIFSGSITERTSHFAIVKNILNYSWQARRETTVSHFSPFQTACVVFPGR